MKYRCELCGDTEDSVAWIDACAICGKTVCDDCGMSFGDEADPDDLHVCCSECMDASDD